MKVGIDLTKISRFSKSQKLWRDKILTSFEKIEYDNLSEDKKLKFLAVHFSFKEAIFKATQDKSYLSYEIRKEENGKPYVYNHDELEISCSHEDDYVVTICIKTN